MRFQKSPPGLDKIHHGMNKITWSYLVAESTHPKCVQRQGSEFRMEPGRTVAGEAKALCHNSNYDENTLLKIAGPN